MSQPVQTAWPEGVIARYLTVGGATVDLTVRLTFQPKPEPYVTVATCTGCPDSKECRHYRTRYGFYNSEPVEDHDPEAAEDEAREWAQKHAETCRAMPQPAA